MIERLCPTCGAANEIHQRECSDCGARIEQPLQRRATTALNRRLTQLPARWQQTGRVVALGVLTVAAEAGLHWLQRRQQSHTIMPASSPPRQQVIAMQQRIIEHWQGGQLQNRMIERTVWLDHDQNKR